MFVDNCHHNTALLAHLAGQSQTYCCHREASSPSSVHLSHTLFSPHSFFAEFCSCLFYTHNDKIAESHKLHRLFGFNVSQWGSPSASDPRAKNTGQRATKGTVLTSQSLLPWCDCRRLGSTLASWRWQDINVGNPL